MRRGWWCDKDRDGWIDGEREIERRVARGQIKMMERGRRTYGEEKEHRSDERERERERRVVDGLDIVSAESSSIKSNYDVIDRGPVGRG